MKKLLFTLFFLLTPFYAVAADGSPSDEGDEKGTVDLGFVIVEDGRIEKTDPRRVDKSDEDMSRELIQDEHDLLRNEVGVSVNEGGRSGPNGFSIRGVDADRVAITVDGMPQAESSHTFIYQGYGYMSSNRNTTEFENLSSVAVAKGADAFKVGSGALGGAVMFKTKDVADFVRPGKKVGLLVKTGIDSRNHQVRGVIGGGFRVNKFEGLLQYTHRKGHETENYGDDYPDIYGPERRGVDPEDATTDSVLAKLGYNFFGDHWLRASFENRVQNRDVVEKSFNGWGFRHRYVDERSPYARYALSYEWMPAKTFVENLSLTYAHQKVEGHAVSTIKDVYSSWSAPSPELVGQEQPGISEMMDRLIRQELDTYELESKSKNLLFANTEHSFKFGAQYRGSEFRNFNHNTNSYGMDDRRIIITPVDTTYYNIRLQDTIFWSDKIETAVGIRYDSYQHEALTEMIDEASEASFNGDAIPAGKKTFQSPTWFASLTYNFTPDIALQYKIGTAFRAPKVMEMYFRYGSDELSANQVHPNPDLDPETALNHEVAFMVEGAFGSATLTGFYTKYKDFIQDRQFTRQVPNPWYDPNAWFPSPEFLETNNFQFINLDSAKVYGVEFAGILDLNWLLDIIPEGTTMDLSMSWQKGDGRVTDKNTGITYVDGLRALQPFQAVVGLGYTNPDQTWGIKLTTRYLGGKKGDDTIKTEFGWSGVLRKESEYLNEEAIVSDLRGYFRITDNLTLSAGINNLFDEKYTTWDKIRSIPEFGTTGMVGQNGEGLDRYTAPGRNFSLVLEYRF